LKPKHALPVSLRGVKKGDYAMVMGYPGSTQRYITSYEVKELMTITNPNRIKIRGLRQDILLKDMLTDKKVDIQYASKYSRSSNYWKYSIGQNQGLKKLNIVAKKEQQEQDFRNWVNADPQRKEKYGDALDLIGKAVEGRAIYQHTLQYTYECLFTATEIIAFANRAHHLYVALSQKPVNQALVDSLTVELRNEYDDFYRNYHVQTDEKVVPAMLKLYEENVPLSYQPTFFALIRSKFHNSTEAYSRYLFDRSIFADSTKMANFFMVWQISETIITGVAGFIWQD
jgi:hypothetical protein